MSDSLWTPEIIATIVYRVIMVLVSLAFIWKQYRQTEPQLDEEQLIGILMRRQSLPPAIGMTSARQDDGQVNSGPNPRLRDHFRANSNNILASALGIDGTSPAAVPLPQLRRPPASSFQTLSDSSLELGEMNVASVMSSRSSPRPAPHSQTTPDSSPGLVGANQTPALASSSTCRSAPRLHSASNTVAGLHGPNDAVPISVPAIHHTGSLHKTMSTSALGRSVTYSRGENNDGL